jgi:NAD-dependent DNA ligase
VPVGQLEGVGEKLRDRLIEADIPSIQTLAQTSLETLLKIEGIGQKTAETLIERAREMAAQLEVEYEKKAKAEAATSKESESDKLTESDVFVAEDDKDYVTEEDDIPEVSAPRLDDVLDDGSVAPIKKSRGVKK